MGMEALVWNTPSSGMGKSPLPLQAILQQKFYSPVGLTLSVSQVLYPLGLPADPTGKAHWSRSLTPVRYGCKSHNMVGRPGGTPLHPKLLKQEDTKGLSRLQSRSKLA